MVVELSVVHAGRECPKHARLVTSQGIEQANRDDPHCSAAGTAVLSSPDEVLSCHHAALRGTIRISSIPVMFNSCAVRCEVDSARFEQTLLFQFLRDVRAVVRRLLEQECLFKPCGIDFTALNLELGDLTLGCHFPRDIDKPG